MVDESFDGLAVALGNVYAEREDAHEHHSSEECSHSRLGFELLNIDTLNNAHRVGLHEAL